MTTKCPFCKNKLTIASTDDNSETIIFCDKNDVTLFFTENFKLWFAQLNSEIDDIFETTVHGLITKLGERAR